MDRLSRVRTPLRIQLITTAYDIKSTLEKGEPDSDSLQVDLRMLQMTMDEISDLDKQIIDLLLDEGATDEKMEAEFKSINQNRREFEDSKHKVEKFLSASIVPKSDSGSGSMISQATCSKTRSYRLPKVELKTFDGDLKQWLGWWSQFEKIHTDEELHPTTKFQYLCQSMKEGTEAKDMIESYPQTAENYEAALGAIRERFGRNDLLLQVYVRELLTLVISNATGKDKTPLSKLYFKLESHLRSLEALNLNQADPATWLFPLVESSLNEDTLRAWQRSPFSRPNVIDQNPQKSRLDLLMSFIKSEVQCDQQIKLAQSGFESVTYSGRKKGNSGKQIIIADSEELATASGLFSTVNSLCVFCDKQHESDKCMKAIGMTLNDRKRLINEKKACGMCLKPGHFKKACRARVMCALCKGKHYPLMCYLTGENNDKTGNTQKQHYPISDSYYAGFPPSAPVMQPSADNFPINAVLLPQNTGNPPSSSSSTNSSSNQCSADVLLNTLKVKMMGVNKMYSIRLVGDTGSQRSYICKRVVQMANCEKVGDEWLQNILFGGQTTEVKRYGKYDVYILGENGLNKCKFQLLERDTISGRLPKVPNGPWIEELKRYGIEIADQGSGCHEIDILLGNDYWGNILTGRILKMKCGLTATETIFGWTLGGRIPKTSSNLATMVSSMLFTSTDVTKLWNLEAIGIMDPIEVSSSADQEKLALEHFASNVKRESSGRYIISLPWKMENPNIPTNRAVAEKRLRNATQKLSREGNFNLYDSVFKEWEKENFITVIENDKDEGHYLPHRPVYKESVTTPVRPVFDASCKYGHNPSLNDCLYKGPNLLELIPALLLRFREGKIGVSSDIRKAFQMLGVTQQDQKYQKYLWWSDATCSSLKVYAHKRVVFGMNCSPFLLGAAINHHLDNIQSEYRDIASKLKLSFYVDNCVTSVETMEEYINFQNVSTLIMAQAQMELRQWSCTLRREQEKDLNFTANEETETVMAILGLMWDRIEDDLSCDIKQANERKITKRQILSIVSQIYDPIGMLTPAVLIPKLILQESWISKIGWDEVLNEDISKRYLNWEKEILQLKNVKVCRHFLLSSTCNRQVHVFCDASQYAYASVAYMRSEENGKVAVRFLMAKSRLAPIKKATIPRLELMACLIGARLGNMIRTALNYPDVQFYYWSDSTTALAWIRNGGEWGTFVNNRVREIMNTTTIQEWKHVPGRDNPADLPSRGCTPHQLVESTWWEGVNWLSLPRENWPKSVEPVNVEEINVEKKKCTTLLCSGMKLHQPTFSSYRKNVAIWGWVLRFVNCCLKKKVCTTKYLTLEEMRLAEKIILRRIQSEAFPNGVAGASVFESYLDENGLLRIRTRLCNRRDASDFVYPVLLPKTHPMVDLLILDFHRFHGHAGIQFIMGKLREKYWIIQSRRVIRKVIRQCVVCRRHESKCVQVEPSSLPARRVNDAQPFQTTGVDLAGPMYVNDGTKAWVVLYTCAVYRAVFLDIVSSLSTEAFLGSLERFIAIYGRPNTIYSDNGTNFVGANNLFKTLDWAEIESTCNTRQIKFIFNPVTASWWGGWWERLVRTVKDLLKRMLGKSRMSFDGLRTCLAGITSTINDRPLTVVSEDSSDLIPLTPSMFLRGIGYGHLPETIGASSLQQGYRKMKQTQAQLQQRFRKEYLAFLVMRRNEKKQIPVAVGDVVLVGADNKKRFEWPLGRIMELLPGPDGKSRVARIQTQGGIMVRPFQRIYPLEISTPKEKLELPGTCVGKDPASEITSDNKYLYVTKKGRMITKPPKYSQWLHLMK